MNYCIRHAAAEKSDCDEMAEKYEWQLVDVEETNDPILEVDCVFEGKYNPINAPLKPMPERQVSVDSFGGDKEAYEQWLADRREAPRSTCTQVSVTDERRVS